MMNEPNKTTGPGSGDSVGDEGSSDAPSDRDNLATTKPENRASAVQAFLSQYAPSPNQDLLADMMVTICRLANDDCSRGEIKILNSALKELRYGFKVFAPYDHVPKVSIFGSSRTEEDHPQYLQAKHFADLMQKEGWMIITGAGDGIMRAGHHGATRESSFGVAIRLPFEQSTNTIIADDDKLVNFKYFFTRKLMFVKEARAIALFPGGFGTQDEGFEALTLIQTGKAEPTPIVLVDEPGGTYWQHWRTYVKAELLGTGMISPDDMNLFYLTDNAEDAVREVVQFYHRYHSSRFVRGRMVMRMKSRLTPAALDRINSTFANIVSSGQFEQSDGPLSDEGGEYPEMPRLAFVYKNNAAGKLRLLINAINTDDTTEAG